MKRRRFLIPSLLAAGLGAHDPARAADKEAGLAPPPADPDAGSLARLYSQDHLFTLASHRSHSSHSSHSSGSGGGGHYSHTSHRSSTGGYDGGSYSYDPPVIPRLPRTPPSPLPSQTAPQPLFTPFERASPPAGDGLAPLSGRTRRFAAIVRRVELALLAQDFYKGPIDGVVTPELRAALRAFQGKRGLEVTGTITPATLDALMVSSQ
jgi:His-Xaa-Ser repeat protein HxsA